MFTVWERRPLALNIGVQNPLSISCDNGVESDLDTPEREQGKGCLDMALALRLGQLVRYPLRELGQNVKCLQVLNHS